MESGKERMLAKDTTSIEGKRRQFMKAFKMDSGSVIQEIRSTRD